MALFKDNKKLMKNNIDKQVKNMIIKDLTHAYDHLNEKDSLMRFSIAKAITDLHFKYLHKDI